MRATFICYEPSLGIRSILAQENRGPFIMSSRATYPCFLGTHPWARRAYHYSSPSLTGHVPCSCIIRVPPISSGTQFQHFGSSCCLEHNYAYFMPSAFTQHKDCPFLSKKFHRLPGSFFVLLSIKNSLIYFNIPSIFICCNSLLFCCNSLLKLLILCNFNHFYYVNQFKG